MLKVWIVLGKYLGGFCVPAVCVCSGMPCGVASIALFFSFADEFQIHFWLSVHVSEFCSFQTSTNVLQLHVLMAERVTTV